MNRTKSAVKNSLVSFLSQILWLIGGFGLQIVFVRMLSAEYDNTDLTAESVADMIISISNQTNSQVFSINVKSGDTKMSKDIANTIAEVFKDKVASIMSVSNVSI